jgi:hypothetical protein
MMSNPFDPLLGFSPLQLAVGSGAVVAGVFALGPDRYSVKESIKQGAVVAAGIYVVYSLVDAL